MATSSEEVQNYTSRATMSLEIKAGARRMIEVQTRVYTRWINARLMKLEKERAGEKSSGASNPVGRCENLLSDLRDGTLLINLTTAITGRKLRVNKGKTQAHFIDNIQEALRCLKSVGVDLTSITEHLINEGNSKATLGLIWKIITFYNHRQLAAFGLSSNKNIRKELLSWCQRHLMSYKSYGVEVTDFGSSWKDGLAFIALMHRFKPKDVNIDDLKELSSNDRLEVAFMIAHKEFGVEQLLDASDMEMFPDKGKAGSPSKRLDDSPVLTYVSELRNSITQQFPEDPRLTLESVTNGIQMVEKSADCTNAIECLEMWINTAEKLVKETPMKGEDGDEEDMHTLVAILESHLQDPDTILHNATAYVQKQTKSLPSVDAQQLQDKLSHLKMQWTSAKDALPVRQAELKFLGCVGIIHRWVHEGQTTLQKLKLIEPRGCVGDVQQLLSQFNVAFDVAFLQRGTEASDTLKRLASELTAFETWNKVDDTRTVCAREVATTQTMASGIAEYGGLLEQWMNQWQVFENDCAAFDRWLSKSELLLGRREDAEKSFAVAPQAFMDSYQDVLKTYKSQHKVLASLESRLEQLRPDESLKKKVKSLRERYEQLEECDINAWLEVFRLFFDEVLAWISRADQVLRTSDDSLRDKSPPSLCQDLFDQLPKVQEAFVTCEQKANENVTQTPDWFSEQLMASKPKLFELKQELEERLEEVRISLAGGEEFNQAVEKLEEKISQAEDLISQQADGETGLSPSVALDKYRAMCNPTWLKDGDDIMREVEQHADEILKSGKSRGAAQLEQQMLELSESWETVKSQLMLERRALEFLIVQAEMETLLNSGLNELDNVETVMGPLETLLNQEQSYRQFFEEMQFESVAESYLKKMQEMANEDKKGGEATANYDDIVSHVTGRLRNLMEVAEKLKKKLDEAINRWTVFETEKSDVEIWMDEKEQTLSGIVSQCEQREMEWNGVEDVDKVLEELTRLLHQVDEYGDFLAPFVETGEQLRDECEEKKVAEHENSVKNLEDRYEHLRYEIEELIRPLSALRSSWHSFVNVSGEIVDWLDDAHTLLKECSQVEEIDEAEGYVNRHKEFFTPQTLKLQNSKLTHLSHLLQEVSTSRTVDRIRCPSHLSTQLQHLNDRYTQICQLQQSELEFIETLWRYLQVAVDIEHYLQEIELLLFKLDCDSQAQDQLQHLHTLLHELIPKQEKLRELEQMRVNLEQAAGDRKVSSSHDEMNRRFEEIKVKQAALFQRRETEEEAQELMAEIRRDVETAREAVNGEIQCDIDEDSAQIERLKEANSLLISHRKTISDLTGKLAGKGSSHSALQKDLTQLTSSIDQTSKDVVAAEKRCEDALVLVDGVKRAVREVGQRVGDVDVALKIPWRKDSTARKLALRDCQASVSDTQCAHQKSNLSAAHESLNALAALSLPNHLVHLTDSVKKVEENWEGAVKRGHSRIRKIQFEQLLLDAREKMKAADTHLKKLEPIVGPSAEIEKQLHSHLEYFLDDFETSMDSLQSSLATFIKSSPTDNDELTQDEVQTKSDEIRNQTEALQSEHGRLKVGMETALNEWQKFDQKWSEMCDWLKGCEKQLEELRDRGSGEGTREREVKLQSLITDVESRRDALKRLVDTGHRLCQKCIQPTDDQIRNQLGDATRRYDQLQNQAASVVAETQSEAAARVSGYEGRARRLTSWLDAVNSDKTSIAAKEATTGEDKRTLQSILNEEPDRKRDLLDVQSSFDALSRDPGFSTAVNVQLRPNAVMTRFSDSLRAVRCCLVRVMLEEADKVLHHGEKIVGNQENFNDALEEQETFFVDGDHQKLEELIQQLGDEEDEDQPDGCVAGQTDDVKLWFDKVKARELQVHSRLASAVGAWKRHDELHAELDGGSNQLQTQLAECRAKPVGTNSQEISERIAQLDSICEYNKEIFSVAEALRQQVDLLATFASPSQHDEISKTVDTLCNGLEDANRAIEDMNADLRGRKQAASTKAKALERQCEKLEKKTNELDQRMRDLPRIEYDVEPLNELTRKIETMNDEVDVLRRQLEGLQKTAAELDGFLDSLVEDRLKQLDTRLENVSISVAGRDAEVSVAARMTHDVMERLDMVENEVTHLDQQFQGELQDRIMALEPQAVREYSGNLQAFRAQLETLRPQLASCLDPLSSRGGAHTQALESRAESLGVRIENVGKRGESQLQALDGLTADLVDLESRTTEIAAWTDAVKERVDGEPNAQELEDLLTELQDNKAKLGRVRVLANTLKSTYPKVDHRRLSQKLEDVKSKLNEVKDTLTTVQAHVNSSLDGNGLDVDVGQLDDLYRPVMVWLEGIETRLQSDEFELVDNIQQIEWKLNQCQGIQSEMDAHTPDYDLVCDKVDGLKRALPESQYPLLDKKLRQLDEKWATVGDLLTDILGSFRDRLTHLLVEATGIVEGNETWLRDNQCWLDSLEDNDDEGNNPLDKLDKLDEVIADANERKAVLDDSQEDRAAELSDEFADFIDKLNEAKERLESVEEEEEVEPSRLDDVDKRLCEIEKALETFQDVDELPGTQIEGERERVQVIASTCHKLRQNLDNLQAERDDNDDDDESGEQPSDVLAGGGADLDTLIDRLTEATTAIERRLDQLKLIKEREGLSRGPRDSWLLWFLSFLFMVVMILFMLSLKYMTFDQSGRPNIFSVNVDGSSPK